MKKLIAFVALIGITFFASCEGNDGPRGPQGPAGPEAEVFEVTANFTPHSDPYFAYRAFFDLNPAIYASDNVLVYELAGVDNGLDIWKLLPQTYFFDQGIMQYNFDFSTNDFSIFIDADFNRAELSNNWTNNRIFRIVIVPGYFSKKALGKAKFPTYEQAVEWYNIKEDNIQHLPMLN